MSTASSIGGDLVPQIAENVAWVELDGEGVLYDEYGQRVHVLSPSATLIWSGIDGRTSLEQIARDLSASFDTDLEMVRADILELARDLLEKGLLSHASQLDGPKERRRRLPKDSDKIGEQEPRFLQEPPGG